MKESKIERFFIKECKKKGWLPLKFVSPSMPGLPDRMVLLPGEWFQNRANCHRNQLKDFPSYRLCAAAVFRTNLFKSPFSLASANTKWCIHKGLHRTQIPVKGKVCLRHLWRCCDSD